MATPPSTRRCYHSFPSPTGSSPAIEAHLHLIPGISSRFIYLNDDVMFGDHVWPEDFFTHNNGQKVRAQPCFRSDEDRRGQRADRRRQRADHSARHPRTYPQPLSSRRVHASWRKVYLSWPVPNCAEGCPSNWIGDKFCDAACNNTACDFDGGDCLNKTATSSHSSSSSTSAFRIFAARSMCSGVAHARARGARTPTARSGRRRCSYTGTYQSTYTSRYCSSGCPDTWIGDRYCDRACNVANCGYDGGDCGTTDLEANLFHVNLSSLGPDHGPIVVPPGRMAFFINLNESYVLPPGARFAEGTINTNKAVRTAGFSEVPRTPRVSPHPAAG